MFCLQNLCHCVRLGIKTQLDPLLLNIESCLIFFLRHIAYVNRFAAWWRLMLLVFASPPVRTWSCWNLDCAVHRDPTVVSPLRDTATSAVGGLCCIVLILCSFKPVTTSALPVIFSHVSGFSVFMGCGMVLLNLEMWQWIIFPAYSS